MHLTVRGPGPAAPFLSARDLFETERRLERPVTVRVVARPDERTRVEHTADDHELTVSRRVATSAMARSLALHEFAHMHRHERGHPSHTQSTKEAIFLALAGEDGAPRRVRDYYQIANHAKDVYADDLWVDLVPAGRLVTYLESGLAETLARDTPEGADRDPEFPPELAAVNAAFALGLVERHGLVGRDHRLYELAHAAATDAPAVELDWFRERFRTLATDPDRREYKQTLVDLSRAYASARAA